MAEEKTPVLEVRGLGIDFGGLTAVNELNLTIYNEEIYGLIASCFGMPRSRQPARRAS